MLLSDEQRKFYASDFGADFRNLFASQTVLPGSRTFYVPIPLPGTSEDSSFPLSKLRDNLQLKLTSKACLESGTGNYCLLKCNFKLQMFHMMYSFGFVKKFSLKMNIKNMRK